MSLRRLVAERDYHEVVTYSFVDSTWEADFAAIPSGIVLANPIASQMGVKIAEVVVNHRARRAGVTKYGLSRTVRVVLDLATVKFLLSYSTRPLQIFGPLGLMAGGLGLLISGWLAYVRLFQHQSISDRPLLLLGVMLLVRDASREASMARLRSGFVSGVSHDLKTPLTSIQGYSQAMLDGVLEDETERAHAAEIVHQEAERMRALVEDLLDKNRKKAAA